MSVKMEDTTELYCTCQMPELCPMIQCSNCEKWFYISCVQESVLQTAMENSNIEWAVDYVASYTIKLIELNIRHSRSINSLYTFQVKFTRSLQLAGERGRG